MDNNYLFVYGTLRMEFGLAMMKEPGSVLRLMGIGKANAVLYDLGDYPGAVKAGKEEIVGDLLEVTDDNVWTVLDEYEGEEFTRQKAKVVLSSGEAMTAWIYWYTGSLINCSRIENGDYLTYLKTKKDRFV